MIDKPMASTAPSGTLADHALIAVSGRDALAFAQAQFMNDVKPLGDGQWQWNGWLTAQGRVIALFALLRRDPETVWLIVPDASGEQLAGALQRYVFRSKVTIQPLPLTVCGAWSRPLHAHGDMAAQGADGEVELDFGSSEGARTLRIGGATRPSLPEPDMALQWATFDIRHGWPRLGGDPKWTPQQLSLDRLRAYSVKKGCYPGQEIVARTHFLGQAKRSALLFECNREGALAVGDSVTNGDATASVASVAGHWILAVGTSAASDHGWTTDAGDPLTRHPMSDGLAR